jgi:hypothetical protein
LDKPLLGQQQKNMFLFCTLADFFLSKKVRQQIGRKDSNSIYKPSAEE